MISQDRLDQLREIITRARASGLDHAAEQAAELLARAIAQNAEEQAAQDGVRPEAATP